MATIPFPRTWADGEIVRAAYFNNDIRAAYEFLFNVPLVHLSNLSGQTAGNASPFLMTWNTADIDTDGMADLSNDRIVINTPGVYEVTLHIDWQPISDNSPSTRKATVQKNSNTTTMATSAEIGADMIRPVDNNTAVPQTNHLQFMHYFNRDDYIRAVARCTEASGGVNTYPSAGGQYLTFFAARWLGAT